MPLLLINILFTLLSVALYVWAPQGYSHDFCSMVLAVYLIQNVCWIVLQGHKRRLRFELFFMISFLFVNFIYPVYYAEVFPHWSFYMRDFNRHIINQATALAYLGYACYMLGITDRPWHHRAEPVRTSLPIGRLHLILLSLIAMLSFAAFVALGGYSALVNVYSGGGNLRDVGLFSYFNNIFSISALLIAAFVFQLPTRRERLPFLALLVLFMLILLSTGSRQFSISIVLMLFVSYSFQIYHIRAWQVIVFTLLGATALFGIMLFRTAGLDPQEWQYILSTRQQVTYLDVFSDLTLNNINLYVLTEWGNTHPLTWLQGVLIDLTSPIPKLGTWLADQYNVPIELLNGGDLPSYILLGPNASWGTGTNMVGELYRSFGVLGMAVFMYGLGVLLREMYYRSAGNIYCYAFYMLMIGHSIMYPRASFVYDPRTVVWSLLLLWLVLDVVRRIHKVRDAAPTTEEPHPTRIVYCIPHLYNAGGMERVLTEKANYLARHTSADIVIVTTDSAPEGMARTYFPLDERVRIEELGLNFADDFALPLWRKYYRHVAKQRRYRRALRAILLREKADICISLCGKEIEWLGDLDIPCRKVAELHFARNYRAQLLAQYHKGFLWRLIGRYLTHQLTCQVRSVDQLVVLTEADRQAWLRAGVKHTVCIPNPTAIPPSHEGQHDRKQVLAVGRLHPQKGFDMLLTAWAEVVEKHPDWVLRIVGEGDSRSALEQQIIQLGLQDSVRMEGRSHDLIADYRTSRIFVLSSRWEGLPLALIEAMGQGCCCIAFDCPEGPRELIEDGVTGRLVANGNTAELARILSEEMDDAAGAARMGEAAYRHAQEHFSIDPIMNQWQHLLGLCN